MLNISTVRYKCVVMLIVLMIMLLSLELSAQNKLNIYGYFSTRLAKKYETTGPSGAAYESSLFEWTSPFFNIMMQDQLNENFKIFINLNGADGTLKVRNYWGEYSLNNMLNFRIGKIYRKFGLYNEILDAVPTYYGIEAPELIDEDHLLLSRTTTVMVYGSFNLPGGDFNYSFTTDNGEGGIVKNAIPLGFDFNYKFRGGDYKIGTSGYVSGGAAVPDVTVGGGTPKGGVLPWMAADNFNVFGGYTEMMFGNLLFQFEYWISEHNAQRNPASVVTIVKNAGLSRTQLSRFLVNPAKNPANVTEGDVIQFTNYSIQTWYVKVGYSFETGIGEIAPYVQWDWYSNPEIIAKKEYGGDNEAGVTDDGSFNMSTVGIVYRPIPAVAVKFEQGFHFYIQDAQNVRYPDLRLDISYIFGN